MFGQWRGEVKVCFRMFPEAMALVDLNLPIWQPATQCLGSRSLEQATSVCVLATCKRRENQFRHGERGEQMINHVIHSNRVECFPAVSDMLWYQSRDQRTTCSLWFSLSTMLCPFACSCACVHMRRMWASYSVTLHVIPFRQGLSLNLVLGL